MLKFKEFKELSDEEYRERIYSNTYEIITKSRGLEKSIEDLKVLVLYCLIGIIGLVLVVGYYFYKYQMLSNELSKIYNQ